MNEKPKTGTTKKPAPTTTTKTATPRTATTRTAAARPTTARPAAQRPAPRPRPNTQPQNPLPLGDKINLTLKKISNHFLLRNTVMALCFGVVLVFLTWLLLNAFTRNGQGYTVPDLTGHNVENIEKFLKDANLKININDSVYIGELEPGTITEQNPKPGSTVKSGRKIFVVINSYTARMAEIPYITGYSLRQAKSILMNKGFHIERLIYKPDIATNNVIGQRYENRDVNSNSKINAPVGDGITLIVGRRSGAALPRVPKVVGMTLNEARGRLTEEGFNVGEIISTGTINKARMGSTLVYRQVPGPETRHDFGGRVTLYLNDDKDIARASSQRSDSQLRKAEEEAAKN